MGGTFDRFHQGHQKLIITALESSEHAVIGITKELLTINKTLSHLIEPYQVRVTNVKNELSKLDALDRVELVSLDTPAGPTLTDTSIDAIVVSTQTKPGGEKINQDRLKLGLPALPIIEADMVNNELGSYLSSTQIRQGLVTRLGGAYASLFNTDIHLSPESLQQVKLPLGELLSPETISLSVLESMTSVVLVGDIVTDYFVSHHLPFQLAIIDGKTMRQPTHKSFSLPTTNISNNPAGSIMAATAGDIIHLLQSPPTPSHLALLEGEEDLLALVPSIVGPIGGGVFYGQPQKGIVMIRLDEAKKITLAHLIDKTFK